MDEHTRGDGSELHRAGERLADDFEQLRDVLAQRADDLRETVTGFVDEHPYAAVGAAFGLGYLLSGALVSRTTGRLLGFGARFLVGAMVKQLVAGGGLGALAQSLGLAGDEGPHHRAPRARMP